MSKIRVAVIGVGHLGSFHANIYKELKTAELAAVCDVSQARTKELSQALNVPAYTDYKKLPTDKIDAVSIAVPTESHYEVAKYFLNKGIHALVEKPICNSLREARALTRLAAKNNVILQVGHVERFNTAIEALNKMAPLPKFIEVHRLGPFKQRSTDIGIVMDLMIHDLDIILSFVKSPVKRIDAAGIKVLTDHEDIANARITFANGTVANITASRLTPNSVRKIRVFIEDAYISLDYAKQEAMLYKKKGKEITQKLVDIKKEQPLQRELASFINTVKKGSTPVVTGEDATGALELALKIQKAIHKGHK